MTTAVLNSPSRNRQLHTKRTFNECYKDDSLNFSFIPHSPPFKKHKAFSPFKAVLSDICSQKRCFTLRKLYFDAELTQRASIDNLFYPPSLRNAMYIQWVIACKFVIASGLRLDCYHVHGMNRTKIPQNMCFYVDHESNLCAVIRDSKPNPMSSQIIAHCDGIATSVVEHYRGMRQDPACIRQGISQLHIAFNHDHDKENINTTTTTTNDGYVCHDDIYIIRIPLIYYKQNMNNSFYALCCRFTKILVNKQNYNHPLFQVFLQKIANFDCFQCSLPSMPLSGSLQEMYDRYAKDCCQLNSEQYKLFVAIYDCWKQQQRRPDCRKMVTSCTFVKQYLNALCLDVLYEYADIKDMNDRQMFLYIHQFNQFDQYH